MNLDSITDKNLLGKLMALATLTEKDPHLLAEELIKAGIEWAKNKYQQPEVRNTVSEQAGTYITQNWKEKTDKEMAAHLNVLKSTVKDHRYRLGLFQKRGRKNIAPAPSIALDDETVQKVIAALGTKKNAELASEYHTTPTVIIGIRRTEAKRLIRLAGMNCNDSGIAKQVGYSSGSMVGSIRHALGITIRGQTQEKKFVKIRDTIDFEDLARAISEGGYTSVEYMRLNQIGGTREYVRQLCADRDIPTGDLAKKPIWHVARWARRHHNPNLLSKEWVEEKFTEARNMRNFSALVKLDINICTKVLDYYQIPRLRRVSDRSDFKMVDLVCEVCKGPFKRSKSYQLSILQTARKAGFPCRSVCSTNCKKLLLRTRKQKDAKS